MHEQIAADLAERPVEHAVLVHLGDYVDRGMESAQVVEWLVAGPPGAGAAGGQPDGQPRAHDAGRDRPGGRGGSRPVAAQRRRGLADELGRGADRPPEGLGRAASRCRTWCSCATWPCTTAIGPYLFVHAGLRPGVPLRAADAGRTCCGSASRSCPRSRTTARWWCTAIHRDASRYVGNNRIGIDTGAVIGGALTCVVLEDEQIGVSSHVKIACETAHAPHYALRMNQIPPGEPPRRSAGPGSRRRGAPAGEHQRAGHRRRDARPLYLRRDDADQPGGAGADPAGDARDRAGRAAPATWCAT